MSRLAPLQEAMLFHSWRSPQSGFEIQQLVGDLHEALSPDDFRQAWQRLMGGHEVLRTRFVLQNGWRAELLEGDLPLPWMEEDWSGRSNAEQEQACSAFLRNDRLRGFDLGGELLWRVTFFHLGPATFRFVWTFHHALLDGRSLPPLLGELFGHTDAFARGVSLDVPTVRPYSDHLQWLAQLDLKPAEIFWRNCLRGFTRPTPLMFETRSDLGDESARGEKETRLSESVTRRLQDIASTNGLTLNTMVQGAWALLCSRATGEEEVLFGATRACRRSGLSDAPSMIGMFINTLPLRVRVDRHRQWLPWLQQLRSQWNELRPYEHTPLIKIRSWSDLPADGAFLESIVVFENITLEDQMRAEGKAWRSRRFQLIEQPGTPLLLAAYGGEQLVLKVLFDRHRIADAMAEQILCCLQMLLTAVAFNPQQRLEELPLLSRTGQQELTVAWNTPRLQFPPQACLHELFAAQAERTPHAVAICCPAGDLTYRELSVRAERIAQILRQRRVGPETRVGVFLERSADLIAGMLGVLKAGGAYVPMDETWPAERLSFLLKDCQAAVVLTQTKLKGLVSAGPAEVICVDQLDTIEPPHDFAPAVPSAVTPDNLAYVIYTSGSTGQPKGVMVTHHNVVRLFQATQPWFQFSSEDVWTLFHSPAFDFSTWEIWGALLHGGKLIVVPHWVTRSPEDFWRLLAREKVTVLNQTPSAFRQLMVFQQAGHPGGSGRLPCRWIIFGGEALDLASLQPWFDRNGDECPQLVNMYGITETTVHVTYRPLRKQDLNRGSVIGVPIPDLELYVLDDRGDPVPVGIPGEIYVGGAGVARGYLDRPELTSTRFVPSPFSPDPGARLYRTGDRARLLPGRDIEYLGRIDQQLKVRGFRIEPGEIEAVLQQHPAVRQAVVMAREIHAGDHRLVAYLVLECPAPSLEEIRSLLKSRLPDYMVPAALVVLDRLPLTSNGKIDRGALPSPGVEALAKAPVFAAPNSGLERTIAHIWQELLGVETVGVHDHFFEMGGHSLLLVQLHARLQTALQRPVPITDLFRCPTIRALSQRLNAEPSPTRPAAQLEQRLRRVEALQDSMT